MTGKPLGSDKSQFTTTDGSSLLAGCLTFSIIAESHVWVGPGCSVKELHPATIIANVKIKQTQKSALEPAECPLAIINSCGPRRPLFGVKPFPQTSVPLSMDAATPAARYSPLASPLGRLGQ